MKVRSCKTDLFASLRSGLNPINVPDQEPIVRILFIITINTSNNAFVILQRIIFYVCVSAVVAHVCAVIGLSHVLYCISCTEASRRPLFRLMVCGVPFRATEYICDINQQPTLVFHHLLCLYHLFSNHNTNVIGNK